ncbi:hypothetical protein QZH41_007056 [Actinostola sp. cb2023]|nr:hypothetical protein QZH41_007056 [Actinostola sp. cb2023]
MEESAIFDKPLLDTMEKGVLEFQCKGKFYRQIHGTAMGSPVSVVISNLVMEELESKAIATYASPPRVFKRYVDDIVCVIKRRDIDTFHQHLNSQDPNIKFTVERYSPEGLPFLDTLNVVNADGSIDISVYRKKTHTGRYLHFESHHPSMHKASVIRTLNNRACSIPTQEQSKREEQQHVFTCLHKENGYPKRFLKRHMLPLKRPDDKDSQIQQPSGFATLPYVEGTTERIKRVLEGYNVKTSIKPLTTLRQLLSKPKDEIPLGKKTGVVYEMPCEDCTAVYVGETKRSLDTRRKEHKASVRLAKTDASALAQHANALNHNIAWEDTRVLASENNWVKRRWTEAWFIARNNQALFNRDCGRTLPNTYFPLLHR